MATGDLVTNVTFSVSHGAGGLRRSQVWHALAVVLVVSLMPFATAAARQKEPAQVQQPATEGVANLPYARGRTFTSLDEYLAHLEKQGAVDLPWWREIRPGVYERVTNMPEAKREVATRAELMQRFGFKR